MVFRRKNSRSAGSSPKNLEKIYIIDHHITNNIHEDDYMKKNHITQEIEDAIFRNLGLQNELEFP